MLMWKRFQDAACAMQSLHDLHGTCLDSSDAGGMQGSPCCQMTDIAELSSRQCAGKPL